MLKNLPATLRKYAVAIYAGAFLFTASTSLIGPMLSNILTDFGMNLNEGGNISMFQYIGGIIAILLSTLIIDKVRKPLFSMICYGGMAVTLVVMGIIPSYLIFCVFYLIFGCFTCIQDSLNNALISDIFHKDRNAALNLMHGICGLGGAFLPFVSGILLDFGVRWNNMYLLTAGALVLIILILLLTYRTVDDPRFTEAPKPSKKEAFRAADFLKDVRVWIALAGIFGFGIFQNGILVWVAKYTEAVYQPSQIVLCTISVSAMWFGTAVSRILQGTVPAFGKISPRTNIIVGSFAAAVILALSMVIHSYWLFIFLIALTCAANAGVLPLLVGQINSWYPNASGIASSSIFVSMYTAYALTPVVMAWIAAGCGIGIILMVPAVGTAVTAVFGFGLKK